jgi:hypothetical protein
MISDQLLRLADGQSLAGTEGEPTASRATTNVIDLDVVRDVGVGETLYARIRFDTTYTQTPAGGANALLVYGDNAALENAVTLCQLPFGSTTPPATDTVIYLPIPPISKLRLDVTGTAKKYLGMIWQIYGDEGSTITGGTWTVDIVTEVNMTEHAYGKNSTFKVV